MDTHEEIIKLLNNICDQINNVTFEEDDEDEDDRRLTDDIKQIQTILYKLWLRLLEWECLLEQQQLGHLQVCLIPFPLSNSLECQENTSLTIIFMLIEHVILFRF